MGKNIFKETTLNNFIKIIITIFIVAVLFFITHEIIINASSITKISQASGIFGPIILILLISLGILFTPIPAGVLVVTAGYLYGTWLGALYAYLGHLIAAIGTFTILRTFNGNGKSKRYEKYKKMVHRNKRILYLLYLVPIIPISVITFFAASSKIKWKEFLKMIFLGFTPAVIFLAFFGERLATRNLTEIIAFSIIILIVLLIIITTIRKNEFVKKDKV